MEDFQAYWSIAKKLEPAKRAQFFSSFSKIEQRHIRSSYQCGGWKDFFLRNEIDGLCDLVKSTYEIDLFEIRTRIIMKDDRYLVLKEIWDDIIDVFSDYDVCCDLSFVFGGVHSKSYPLNPAYYELYGK